MYKCKIFTDNSHGWLEKRVNDWLKETSGKIIIRDMQYAVGADDTVSAFSVCIFYEGDA